MGLFQPWQLIWFAAALVVLLLYLAGRRRVVEVSSHLLWQRTMEKQSAWRRWQRGISAALVALLLVLLTGVLAEPYWRSDRAAARTIVLVLGRTGELNPDAAAVGPDAPDDGQEPLAASRTKALELIDGMQIYERMAIISASGPPHVICPLTDDRVKLRGAIQTVSSSKAAAVMVAEATQLAEWMVAAQQHPEILVLDAEGRFSSGHPALVRNKQSDPPGAWLLVLAVALCGGEWLLFSRRVTV